MWCGHSRLPDAGFAVNPKHRLPGIGLKFTGNLLPPPFKDPLTGAWIVLTPTAAVRADRPPERTDPNKWDVSNCL